MIAQDIVGIVLAGGFSSRLGTDKAALDLFGDGSDLLTHTVQLLAEVTSGVLVIGREHSEFPYRLDTTPGHGPLGGVATALQVTGKACLALSCDMPLMDKSTLKRLIAHRNQRPSNTLLTTFVDATTGSVESLASIYELQSLPYLDRCLVQKKVKLKLSIPEEQQHRLSYSIEESLPFFNINYPADLRILQLYLQASKNSKMVTSIEPFLA